MTTDAWDLDWATGTGGVFGQIRKLAQAAVQIAQPQYTSEAWAEPAPVPQYNIAEPVAPPVYDWQQAQATTAPVAADFSPPIPGSTAPWMPAPEDTPLRTEGTLRGQLLDTYAEQGTPIANTLNVGSEAFFGRIPEATNFWRNVGADALSIMTRQNLPTGENVGPTRAQTDPIGAFIGESFGPASPAEFLLSATPGIGDIDALYDLGRAGIRGAGRVGASYADNLARMGDAVIPEGAVSRTVAPPAVFEGGGSPVQAISPTEGYDISPLAGAAESPEEIARALGSATTPELTIRKQITDANPTLDQLKEMAAGYNLPPLKNADGSVRKPTKVNLTTQIVDYLAGLTRTADEVPVAPGQVPPRTPPPVEPPLNLGGMAEPPVPGASAGKPVSYAGTQFAPTQPLLDSPGPLFDAPPAEGSIPTGAPPTPALQAQIRADDTRQIVKGLPEESQGKVTDFINAARQQLQARPDNPSAVRRITAPISGNLQSPFDDELANQEGSLRQLLVPSITKTELDPKTAMEKVRDVQLAFRKQMLDERYGPTPTEARKRAEETLKEGDRRRMVSGTTGQIYDAASDIFKQAVLGLDIIASGGQQGLRAARGAPSVVLGLINRLVETMGVDTGIWQGDHLAQMLADGLPIGRGAAGLNERSVVARIPKVGPAIENITTLQFQGLDKVGALSYEGQMLINKVLHSIPGVGKLLGGDISDPQVRRNIARHAATVRSSAMAPTGARRAGIERRGLLSGPMTRAQINEALTFFQDPLRPENRLAALNLIGGTALVAAAGKQIHDELGAEGATYETNPFKPDFGVITTKFKNADGLNIKISVMPQTSIPRGVLTAASAALNDDPNAALEAITRTGVGRMNVLPADILRTAPRIGYDKSGFNIDLPSKDALVASIPAPLSYQDQLIRGDFSVPSILASQSGLTNYEESTYEAFDRQFTRLTGKDPQDMLPGEVFDLAQGNPDLKGFYENWQQGRDSMSAQISQEKYQALGDAAPLLETDPRAYREAASSAVDRARIRYEQAKIDGEIPDFAKQKGIRKAYDGFFEAIKPASAEGKVDYDLQEQLSTDYLNSLDAETRERILKELTFSPDQNYRGLLEARQELRPYFDIIDQDWKEAQQRNDRLAEYDSPDEYITAQQLRFMERGISRDEARDMATELAGIYTGDARDKQEIYLLKNRELLPLLYKYGYYIPADLKDLAAIPAR